MAKLRANSLDADVREGRFIPRMPYSQAKHRLWVVAPNSIALGVLAVQPAAFVNNVEVAVDVICETDAEASNLLWKVAEHFVHPRRRNHQLKCLPSGFYTGQRRAGLVFSGYVGKASKATGAPHCFKLEGRHQGLAAVRRIGVHHPRDLLVFDFGRYWDKHLRLFDVNLDLVGRAYSNRMRKERRQKIQNQIVGATTYGDRAAGALLYRHYSLHPDTGFRSVQRFIERFGRGAYISRLPIRSPSQIRSLI